MPLAELAALVDVLFKIKDVKDLLVQERLMVVIECLEIVGEVHFKTAIEELRAMPDSTRPDDECTRAIGHLKVAANALATSLERRSRLGLRLPFGRRKKRKKQTYLRITCCYLLVTGLYRCQHNMELAGQYAARASEAFEGYAEIRRREESTWLSIRFTYNCGTDQAPKVCVIDCPELRSYMERYGIPGTPDEGTFNELASAIVRKERDRLFGSLELP